MSNTATQLHLAAEQRQNSWDHGSQTLPTHLHTAQIMKLFGVSQATVLGWHHDGMLEADQPPVRGKRQAYRYPRSRVVKFAEQNELELNLEAVGLNPDVEASQ